MEIRVIDRCTQSRRVGHPWVLTAVLGLPLLLSQGLRAQEGPPSPEASVAPAAEAKPAGEVKPATKDAPKPVASAGKEGFVLQSEARDFKLQLRGLVQFDGRFFLDDSNKTLTSTFLLRRLRPILQGTVAKYFDFSFTPDFGGGSATIQDAFVFAKASAALGLRVGKFKPPIGVEHLQSDAYVAFPERALPSGLVPSRDLGIQVQGDLAKGMLSYAVGVFNGTPDGASVDTDTNDGKAVVGRLVISPFKGGNSPLRGLGLGVAASTEDQAGVTATAAGYKSAGQSTFFSYSTGVAPSGTRTRLSPELSFFSGPVGMLAEYVQSKGELLKTTVTAATSTAPATTSTTGPFEFANRSWQATATVFLTGDDASYDGPKIKRPFDPAKGQWGGLQLALRANGLEADEDGFTKGFADASRSARKAAGWGVGLNWYLNQNLKQVVSFERTTFTGGAAQGGDRAAENALIIRTQLAF